MTQANTNMDLSIPPLPSSAGLPPLSEAAIQFLTERGLESHIASSVGVESTHDAISFPYGVSVRKWRYRKIGPGKEVWCSRLKPEEEEKWAWPFFNQQDFEDRSYIIITEGEFDTLAGIQLGFTNCVSVPNGANSAVKAIKQNFQYLQQFDEIYICFDNDESGHKAAAEAVENLPQLKWRKINLPGQTKDLNELLLQGILPSHFKALMRKAEKKQLESIINVKHILDECLEEDDPGFNTGWDNLNDLLGGIRLGELTILTGDTGCGKTTFGVNLMYNLANQGHNVYISSYEVSYKAIVKKMMSVHCQKNLFYFPQTEEEKTKFKEWVEKDVFFVNKTFGGSNLKDILNEIEYIAVVEKAKIVMLDHLHFFLDFNGKDSTERQMIDYTVRQLVKAARENNVHIILVVHPKQGKDDSGEVTMAMLKGSSAIKQDAHNIIAIQRNDRINPQDKGKVTVKVLKNRIYGTEGSLSFYYDALKGTYTPTLQDFPKKEEPKLDKLYLNSWE